MRSNIFSFSTFFCFGILVFFKSTLVWGRHGRDQHFSVPIKKNFVLCLVPVPVKKKILVPIPVLVKKKIGSSPGQKKSVRVLFKKKIRPNPGSTRTWTILPISSLELEKAS